MTPNNTDIVPAKQTEITTEKAEDSVIHSDEFLIMAFKDLAASEILYKSELYPQAVSLLQQSVEKGFKSLGIHFCLPKSDPKENHHDPLKMIVEEAELQRRRQKKILKDRQKVDRINITLQKIGINFDDFADEMEKGNIFLKKIIDEQSHEYNISNNKLISIVDEMKNVLSIITMAHNLSPEDNNHILTMILELTPDILDNNLILRYDKDDISVEQKKQNILNAFEWLKKISFPPDFCQNISAFMFLIIGSFILFFDLSLITAPHVARARYPQLDEGLDPAEYYTDELPLVQHLPELYTYTHIALDWLEELYDLGENLTLNLNDGNVD